jgi:hypothetical protein
MVTPVDGHPPDHVTLEAHRTRDRQHDAQPREGGETAMGDEAVETDTDSQPGDGVEGQRQQHVDRPDPVAPQHPYRDRQPCERDRDDQTGQQHLESSPARPCFDGGAGKGLHTVIGGKPLLGSHDHSRVMKRRV